MLAGPGVRISRPEVRGSRLGLLPTGNREPWAACEQGRTKISSGGSAPCVWGLPPVLCTDIMGLGVVLAFFTV